MDSLKVESSLEDEGKKKFQILLIKEFIKGWNKEESGEVAEGIPIC
jgi:hypothetical protein